MTVSERANLTKFRNSRVRLVASQLPKIYLHLLCDRHLLWLREIFVSTLEISAFAFTSTFTFTFTFAFPLMPQLKQGALSDVLLASIGSYVICLAYFMFPKSALRQRWYRRRWRRQKQQHNNHRLDVFSLSFFVLQHWCTTLLCLARKLVGFSNGLGHEQANSVTSA